MTYPKTTDFLIEVQDGGYPGYFLVHKFGRNPDVPNGSWEFCSLLGHTGWPLSAATQVRIKSGGNVADDSSGSGARAVTIQGIDANFKEVSEVLTTAGASASASSVNSYWRVHRAWVSSAGTYGGANVGDIVIESTGAVDCIQIGAGDGQTQFAGWTIPEGYEAALLSICVTVDSNKAANVRMFTREQIDVVSAPVQSKRLKLNFDAISGSLPFEPRSPLKFLPGKTDIWFEAYGNGGTAAVSVDFELLVKMDPEAG